MPYVLRRKTTAHLSRAITALFKRCVPGFHSDAFFLDFYMALLGGGGWGFGGLGGWGWGGGGPRSQAEPKAAGKIASFTRAKRCFLGSSLSRATSIVPEMVL